MSIPSVVCNGCSLHLQSCVDSPLLELTSKTSPSLLWLQEQEDIEEERNSKVKTSSTVVGGWSFLEALANPSHTQKAYVHPLANRSASSTMNTKSLSMCTESLGSETGSDDICESCCMDECSASLFLLEKQKYQQGFSKSYGFKKMKGKKGSFPPPLTSISRLEGVQVRPFREEGRLVIKAVNVATTPASYFHTHRSNGRLTLSLRKPEHIESQEEEEEDDDDDEAEKVTQI